MQLPGIKEPYLVSFNQRYEVEEGQETPDGKILLNGPPVAILAFRDFTVVGKDSNVIPLVSARIELPEVIPGETVFLRYGLEDNFTPPFLIDSARLATVTASVLISYDGVEVRREPIELGREFRFRPLPQATGPEPAAATASATVTDPVAAVPEAVPPARPPWEVDFDRLPAEAYVQRWPEKTEFVHRALARILLRPQVKEISTNVYELTFRNVRAVRLDSVTGGTAYETRLNEALPPFGHRLVVAVSDTGVYRLHLSDSTKIKARTVVPLDNLLAGDFRTTGDTVHFAFRGGTPPYLLLFLRDGVPVTDKHIGTDTSWTATMAQLRDIVGRGGDFQLELTDDQRAVSWNFGRQVLQVPVEGRKKSDPLVLVLVGAGLLLLGSWLGIRGFRRSRRRRKIQENIRSPDINTGTAGTAPARPPGQRQPSSPAIQSTVYPRRRKQRGSPTVVPAGFRVTKRAYSGAVNGTFNPDTEPEKFLSLPIMDLWARTRITSLLFGKEAILVLDEFLRRENLSKIIRGGDLAHPGGWERNEDIPEIGGMLMGQYRPESGGPGYRVSVEHFVPLEARHQNIVKMEIDPLSLARDLGRAQDDYPDLTVVGWFHTHPGHGLFLSQPDLKVQYGHFREPFHFAMEIDPLTENLDTAFFTYLPEGVMNNRDTRRPGSNWLSWREIERFTRRNTTTPL
ncbi:hypothetical protein [Lewinella sp. IMCC34183]|uniref:hypothetical protein n=1 Tax=Lewinella sp. IMCC34183 TaxID=2248762 RepID=UPI0013002615|nr:hypothetical protein [Lewinella sp. IMCC34183]